MLKDGDSGTLIKNLKIRGIFNMLKRGSLVKNIKLTEDEDELEGRIDRVQMLMRTESLKKS